MLTFHGRLITLQFSLGPCLSVRISNNPDFAWVYRLAVYTRRRRCASNKYSQRTFSSINRNYCLETPPIYLGPVVQSVVSLTSSLRVISLTVLADLIYNILIFFAEKMWVLSYSHFFSKTFQHICVSLNVNFNESLTNDVVIFEQLCPGIFIKSVRKGITIIVNITLTLFSLADQNI